MTQAAAQHARIVSRLEDLVEAGERFPCLYCDPPWQYRNSGARGAAAKHYGCMSQEELAALPVGELADSRCHLHLWTTTSFLQEALDLMRHWGFVYKSQLVWCKSHLGMGARWRISHELLLCGARGRLPFADHSIRSWFEAPRTRHSEKPELARELIERVSPPPRLEMFARKATPGWVCWGNEVETDLLSLAG